MSASTTVGFRSWEWKKLGDVGRIVTGNTPATADSSNYGSDVPFVKPSDLLDRSIHDAPQGLSAAGAQLGRVVPAGSVLVSCIGVLGKTGLARVPVALNQQINAVTFREDVIPEFGLYYCQTLRSWLHSQSSATTLPIVNKGKFQQAPFPLVPLNEQRAIVAEIEKQFSRLDEAVANLRRVEANLRRSKAAILKVAVEGRLVPTEAELAQRQGRSFEKAEDFLKPVVRDGKARKLGWDSERRASPEDSGLKEVPEGWSLATIGQLARVWSTGHLPRRTSPEPVYLCFAWATSSMATLT